MKVDTANFLFSFSAACGILEKVLFSLVKKSYFFYLFRCISLLYFDTHWNSTPLRNVGADDHAHTRVNQHLLCWHCRCLLSCAAAQRDLWWTGLGSQLQTVCVWFCVSVHVRTRCHPKGRSILPVLQNEDILLVIAFFLTALLKVWPQLGLD